MTRVLRFFVLIAAILVLCAPSASLGMGVTGMAWTHSHSSVHAKVVNCKSLGGKRVLPCHIDLGVMARMTPIMAAPINQPTAHSVALPMVAVTPEAELPPPRGA